MVFFVIQVYTWLCGLFAALGSVTFGYDLGIIASVLVSSSAQLGSTTGLIVSHDIIAF